MRMRVVKPRHTRSAGVGAALLLLMAVAPALACTGDCDGNGEVTIEELMKGVNIDLGSAPMSECPVWDAAGDGAVTVDELLAGVKAAIDGCPAPIINTIAGTGIAGLNDDGQSPLQTQLYLPQDVTVGPDGSLYLVDWNNHRIRVVRNNTVETFAGSGYLGDASGDDPATIDFNHPTNVCFDHSGDMIVAAWHNSLVKKIDVLPDGSPGVVTTLAGTGARAFGGDEGPGIEARLDLPSSVVVDTQGNIIISDQANYRLRLLEPNGIIHTICGTGTPGFLGDGGPAEQAQINGPKGQSAPPASRIAIDARNRIYIADTGNHRIRRIDELGNITSIAGTGIPGYSGDGGPAVDAQLNTPSDVAIAPNGTLYIADTNNSVVRVITPDGIIHTFAGTGTRGFSGDGGPATAAQLDRPYGVELAPNGDLYIADTHNQRIREVTGAGLAQPTPIPSPPPTVIPCTDTIGSICTYTGTGGQGFDGDGKDRLLTTIYWPFDIEFTPSGRRIFLDWNNHKVREILPDDTIVTLMGSDFVGDGPKDLSDLQEGGADPLTVDLNHPTEVKEFPNGDLAVMCWHNHKIRELSKADGRARVLIGRGAGFAGDGGRAFDALVNQPPHGEFDADGNLFFIDQRNQRVRVLHDFATLRKEAIVDTVAGSGTRGFNGDGAALERQFNFPTGGNPEPSGGLALGPDGALYFADTNNNMIRKLVFSDPGTFKQGVVTTVAGTGSEGFAGDGGQATQALLDYPADLEFGPDGNLYFADADNNRVRRIELASGIITTVAGTGDGIYSGDGGPATDAGLNRPFGVSFDENCDLYISDTFNSRIRKVKLWSDCAAAAAD
jgi:sugar lactone lactonase YvrE